MREHHLPRQAILGLQVLLMGRREGDVPISPARLLLMEAFLYCLSVVAVGAFVAFLPVIIADLRGYL